MSTSSEFNLSDRFGSLNIPYQLGELESLLNQCTARVSRFGRNIMLLSAPAYSSNTFSLETLTQAVLDAEIFRFDQEDLTIAERISGMNILRKLKGWYAATDEQAPTLIKTMSEARKRLEVPTNPPYFQAFSEESLSAHDFTTTSCSSKITTADRKVFYVVPELLLRKRTTNS